MSEFENKPSESSELGELKEQVAALNRQATFLFIALVVLSFTLTAFLGLQWRRAGKELDAMKQQVAQMQQTGKQEGPQVQALFGRLVEYGKTHPDLTPLLNKYGAKPAAAPAAPAKK